MTRSLRTPSAVQLLAIWEQGLGQPPAQQGLSLLAAALPDIPEEELAALSIGRRDGHLLDLREGTFGPQLTSLATCPACQEPLELAFDVSDVRISDDVRIPDNGDGPAGASQAVEMDGYHVEFRLPNSLDLAALPGSQAGAEGLESALLSRCLLSVSRKGKRLTGAEPDSLPPRVTAAVLEHMAQADPQADVSLALSCPACDHHWQALFDILSFYWAELDAWAKRTLGEVHTLAWAYGWRETDILAMNPMRRQAYLEMVAG